MEILRQHSVRNTEQSTTMNTLTMLQYFETQNHTSAAMRTNYKRNKQNVRHNINPKKNRENENVQTECLEGEVVMDHTSTHQRRMESLSL